MRRISTIGYAKSAPRRAVGLAPQCKDDIDSHVQVLWGDVIQAGLRNWQENKLDSAKTLLRQAVALRPAHPRAALALGQIYVSESKIDSAAAALNQAAAAAGNDLLASRGLSDRVAEAREEMTVATQAEPTEAQWRDLLFAWKVCKHVRSNAIVFARDEATIGIGAGQMSRVDSSFLAVHKARQQGHDPNGAVLASDAFFPFPDGVEEAAAAGVTAIIQPGGSVKDAEVIAAADKYDMAMILTGMRQFRH